MVVLIDFRKQLLFGFYKFDSFKGLDSKELRIEEYEAFIVSGPIAMVWSP